MALNRKAWESSVIPALGCAVSVSVDTVTISRTLLSSSLAGASERIIDVAQITDASLQAPSATLPGAVTLELSGAADGTKNEPAGTVLVRFAPHQAGQAEMFYRAVESARSGETPVDDAQALPVEGLNALALGVCFSSANSGALRAVAAVPVRGGQPDEPVDITSADDMARVLRQVQESQGTDAGAVLVAHNAQLVCGELLRAGYFDSSPALSFGCTLALSRALDATLTDHSLGGVTASVGLGDASGAGAAFASPAQLARENAQNVARVLAALARRASAPAGTDELFYSQQLCLGSVDPQAHSILPVLIDMSGATIASARSVGRKPDPGAAGSQGEDAQAEAAPRRGPAPWARVATPEEIPEPNPDADPSGLLFSQTVTLTGDFSPFDKGQLWAGIAHRGGQVAKNVTKKTSILVVGEWNTVTSKEKRARELQEAGQNIQIWQASDLIATLGLDEEPPF